MVDTPISQQLVVSLGQHPLDLARRVTAVALRHGSFQEIPSVSYAKPGRLVAADPDFPTGNYLPEHVVERCEYS